MFDKDRRRPPLTTTSYAGDTWPDTHTPDGEPLPRDPSDGMLESLLVDQSVARNPDGSSTSSFVIHTRQAITPGTRNPSNGAIVFRRGDVDGSAVADITDALLHLQFQFTGDVPMDCHDAGDVDDSGALDVSDPLNLLIALFIGTPPVPEPGLASCGDDPTADDLPECDYPAEVCE